MFSYSHMFLILWQDNWTLCCIIYYDNTCEDIAYGYNNQREKLYGFILFVVLNWCIKILWSNNIQNYLITRNVCTLLNGFDYSFLK